MEQRKEEKVQEIDSEYGKWFGVTFFDLNKIFIDKDLPDDRKRKTLYHELTHCYINSYIGHTDREYCEEEVCDIVANCSEIIGRVVNEYFDKK